MKQTEIGLIPDDWNYVLLKDVAKFQQGYQIYFANQTKYKLPGFDRYLYITDFYSDSNILFVKDSINYYHISKKDICIANTGASAGKAFRNKTGILSNNMFKIFLSDKLDEDYAWCFFNSPLYEKELNEHLNSAGQPHVGHKNMGNMQIPVPPTVAEQQRIAKALSDVDALISTTEKLIQKKKNIKQGTMQNLLTGKKRLPGFAKSTEYKQTELGLIPEDWDVKNVGSLLKIGHGKDYKKLKEGDVPVFGTGGYMTSVDSFLYNGETVCIGRKGTIDKPFYHEGKIWTVDTLFYTYDFAKCIPKYIFYSFCLVDWLSMNEASGVPSLTSKNIEDVMLRIPSKEEQTAIANVLSCMDKEIQTLNTKLEKYRNLKTAMMQQLLTGKIRMVEYEA